MTRIVLARFDSVASARSAAHALIADGIREDAVSLLREDDARVDKPRSRVQGPDFSTPSDWYGAIASAAALAMMGALLGALAIQLVPDPGRAATLAGAAIGAYAGAVVGTIWVLRGVRRARRRAAEWAEDADSRGVVLVVHIHPDDENNVVTLLRDAGGRHIQREQNRYRPAWKVPVRGFVRARQWQRQ